VSAGTVEVCVDLPLIFAMLFGGCCAGYEESEEVWREGYDQERLDALAGAYAPVATSTGDTADSKARRFMSRSAWTYASRLLRCA